MRIRDLCSRQCKEQHTNSPRSVDGIYLRPVSSLQGSHEVLNLATGKRIVCTRVITCKIHEGVIKMVEDMAENEAIRSLKFSNRKNESVHLHDNDLTTEVSGNDLVSEACYSEVEDSEEEWDENELQETISYMKSNDAVRNDKEDENIFVKPLEDNDEIGQVLQNEEKTDKIMWPKLFIEEQGYEIERNILFQDNKSSILLESNGRKSAGKRSRHINIRYFL